MYRLNLAAIVGLVLVGLLGVALQPAHAQRPQIQPYAVAMVAPKLDSSAAQWLGKLCPREAQGMVTIGACANFFDFTNTGVNVQTREQCEGISPGCGCADASSAVNKVPAGSTCCQCPFTMKSSS